VGEHEGAAPVVLVGRRGKWVLALVVGLWFAAGGAIGVSNGRSFGWLPLVFFGVVALMAAVSLVWPATLTVDADGLTCRNVLGRQRFEFQDCSEFSVWSPARFGTGVVAFDWAKSRGRARAGGGGMLKSPGNAALPDTYGMSAGELAALLNRHRCAALGGR
jgi:hypothetical protein